MSNFDRAFEDLLGNEGGYSNDPRDPGGETIWGITVRVARENGYDGEMRNMSIEIAKRIYRRKYWVPELDQLNYSIAFQLFDAVVNSGFNGPIRWLQRTVGAVDDGVLGPKTLELVNQADPLKVVIGFNVERLTFYTNLVTWDAFGRGWTRRVINNLRRSLS